MAVGGVVADEDAARFLVVRVGCGAIDSDATGTEVVVVVIVVVEGGIVADEDTARFFVGGVVETAAARSWA